MDIVKVAEDFDRIWRKPSAAKLTSLLHDDTVLYQPHLPPIRGKQNAFREFQLFLNWMPRFHGEVQQIAANGNLLFIEWQMLFEFKEKKCPVQAIDRIVVKDGLILERLVMFNTLAILKHIIKSPTDWPAYFRYRFAKRD